MKKDPKNKDEVKKQDQHHWIPRYDPDRMDESIANERSRKIPDGTQWKMQAPNPWPKPKDEPKKEQSSEEQSG